MRISFRGVITFLISIVIFALIYSYASQQEVPLWMLQFTFYAFMTAIFGFIFLGILAPLIRERLKETKMKKIEEAEALDSLKKEYERCAWSIGNNIEKYVEKNELNFSFQASLIEPSIVGKAKISEELKQQVQKYNEKYEPYNALLKASKAAIKFFIEGSVRELFPKTLNKPYPLDESLQVDYLMARYLNGEKVTESWFKENHPRAFKNILKDIDISEKDELVILFHKLNDEFKRDPVLQRFRKEKKDLKRHGQETIKALQREINSLNEQLNKYSNLRMFKDEEIGIPE